MSHDTVNPMADAQASIDIEVSARRQQSRDALGLAFGGRQQQRSGAGVEGGVWRSVAGE